jgi:hypothetical protein
MTTDARRRPDGLLASYSVAYGPRTAAVRGRARGGTLGGGGAEERRPWPSGTASSSPSGTSGTTPPPSTAISARATSTSATAWPCSAAWRAASRAWATPSASSLRRQPRGPISSFFLHREVPPLTAAECHSIRVFVESRQGQPLTQAFRQRPEYPASWTYSPGVSLVTSRAICLAVSRSALWPVESQLNQERCSFETTKKRVRAAPARCPLPVSAAVGSPLDAPSAGLQSVASIRLYEFPIASPFRLVSRTRQGNSQPT